MSSSGKIEMTRIGIFGGTFDPPHLGHLILAAEAKDQLGLERLLWVLTPQPPHKRGQVITPVQTRLEMLQAALEDEACFSMSRVDIDRPGPHYAVDTVRLVAEQYPHSELTFLMGSDSLMDLPTWKQPLRFVNACDALGVMRRPGNGVDLQVLERQLPGVTGKLRWVQAPLLGISSSQIRQRAAQGKPFRYFLSKAVYDYICTKNLYREPIKP